MLPNFVFVQLSYYPGTRVDAEFPQCGGCAEWDGLANAATYVDGGATGKKLSSFNNHNITLRALWKGIGV